MVVGVNRKFSFLNRNGFLLNDAKQTVNRS